MPAALHSPHHANVVWDPSQYLKFADERTRPAIDLLARVPLESPVRVYDLGCGAGNVTRLLRLRWPTAFITGVDGSEEMLDRARDTLPSVQWVRADLATWRPSDPAHLIYSNAALHWLEDHEHLFPDLMGSLGKGGVLAVQMPRNFSSPSHTAIAEIVRGGPWRARLEPLLRASPVADAPFYYDLLAPHAAALDLWETEYLHVLSGPDPVKEWVKGSALKPFLDALDASERGSFESEYAERVRAAYPPRPDGRTLFPFRRLFIVATRRDET